jgi:hypothetical protein
LKSKQHGTGLKTDKSTNGIREKNPETDPLFYEQLIFNKVSKKNNAEKTFSSMNDVRRTTCKRVKLYPYLIQYKSKAQTGLKT